MTSFHFFKKSLLIISTVLFMFVNISCALSNDFIVNREESVYMNESLKLEIELDKESYVFEEPITIKCKLENLTKEAINSTLLLFGDISLYIKYENEEKPSLLDTYTLPRELLNKKSVIKIGPGEVYFFKKIIFKEAYFMPSKIGQYKLYIVYHNVMNELSGIKLWTGSIRSNTIEITIKTNRSNRGKQQGQTSTLETN